jgi:hypothetical protein
VKKQRLSDYALEIIREGATLSHYTRGNILNGFVSADVKRSVDKHTLDVAAQPDIGRSLVKFNSAPGTGKMQMSQTLRAEFSIVPDADFHFHPQAPKNFNSEIAEALRGNAEATIQAAMHWPAGRQAAIAQCAAGIAT